MFKATTLFSILLAAALGFSLFLLKYEVQSVEDELIALDKSLINDRQAIHVLKAEWSMLNDPDRLRVLSEKYLGLKPLTAQQVTTENNLSNLLPVVETEKPETISAEDNIQSTGPQNQKINVTLKKDGQP